MIATLRNGVDVSGKLYQGKVCAKTFANRTQAKREADLLGDGWAVYRPSLRNWYVARVITLPICSRRVTP